MKRCFFFLWRREGTKDDGQSIGAELVIFGLEHGELWGLRNSVSFQRGQELDDTKRRRWNCADSQKLSGFVLSVQCVVYFSRREKGATSIPEVFRLAIQQTDLFSQARGPFRDPFSRDLRPFAVVLSRC